MHVHRNSDAYGHHVQLNILHACSIKFKTHPRSTFLSAFVLSHGRWLLQTFSGLIPIFSPVFPPESSCLQLLGTFSSAQPLKLSKKVPCIYERMHVKQTCACMHAWKNVIVTKQFKIEKLQHARSCVVMHDMYKAKARWDGSPLYIFWTSSEDFFKLTQYLRILDHKNIQFKQVHIMHVCACVQFAQQQASNHQHPSFWHRLSPW